LGAFSARRLFASLLFLNFGVRGLTVAFVSLLVGYWALMAFVPVPEIGAGSSGRSNLKTGHSC
jgi:predicted acyltransferase